MHTKPPLRLLVLGPPRIERGGRPVDLNLRRALALLIYLAVGERAHHRDALAALLWPDADERDGRARLRRTLHRLTETLGNDLFLAEADTLRLSPATDLWVDCRELERHAAAGLAPDTPEAAPSADQLDHLNTAANLYLDDFLTGFSLPDSPAWDEWQFLHREHLRQTAARVLERLARAQAAQGRWEPAAEHARRWLALDQTNEPAHRLLMELYAQAGQRALALRQFHECARILEAEIGASPEDETVALYEAIRTRRRTAPTPSAAPDRAEAVAPPPPRRSLRLVGRSREFAALHALLPRALRGSRQIVFVTGEAGLGKTALVDTFLAEARANASVWIAHGQCVEQHGPGEPYMPVLEALQRLCRTEGGESVAATLTRHAPTWVLQMPGLVSATELQAIEARALGATPERMLREMADALEALAAQRPLVLVLEDLHWADYATVDLLALLARRRDTARLLVVGTYRPADARAAEHPLHPIVQELRARGSCEELALPRLDEQAVREYLAARFQAGLPDGLAGVVHRRTEGSPLFMVTAVDWWVGQQLLAPDGDQWTPRAGLDMLAEKVPDTLRDLIEQQLDRQPAADRELLETASVVGTEFSAAAVAAGLEETEEQVEARCAALARRGQFLQGRDTVEWPDGTVAAGFGFVHHLYQQVLYERVTPARRARLHREIGQRLEAAYGPRTRQIAAELAMHFVRGRDVRRAVQYLLLAAEQALERSAPRAAVEQLTTALEILEGWPDGPERSQHELVLQAALGPALIATEGWGSARAERACLRAHQLGNEVKGAPQGIKALFTLAALHEWRGEYEKSQALMEQRLRRPGTQPTDDWVLESYDLLACSLFHQGKFGPALEQAEAGLTLYVADQQHALIAAFGEDPGVQCHCWAALSLWCLGYPDRALRRVQIALDLAREHPYSMASAQGFVAHVHQLRRDLRRTRAWAETTLALATEQGFSYRVALGKALRGWAIAVEGAPAEGIAELREGLAVCRDTGAVIDYPYFLALLAEAQGRAGQIEAGLETLAEALAMVRESRSFFYEAELHRLRGELLAPAGGDGPIVEAERSFQDALQIARHHGGRSLELRAATSLADLWRRHGRSDDAADLLAPVRDWFEEGFDTSDLSAARALLAELRRDPAPSKEAPTPT